MLRLESFKTLRADRLSQAGQAMTEYAIFTAAMMVGSGVALGAFLPLALRAYQHYIHGYWMVLGLPIP